MKWTIAGESREAQARPVQDGRFSVALGERVIDLAARVDHDGVLVIEMGDGRVVRAALTRGVGAAADERWVSVGGRTLRAQVMRPKARVGEHGGGASMQAPMPGRIVRVEVAVGDVVTKGQTVVTLEAMKMEHALKAPRDGVVREVGCREGELVQAGVALVVLAEAGDEEEAE